MQYQQMDAIFQKLLTRAAGKSLMNTIRQHFIMNFTQNWSVEKRSLFKIYQKKGELFIPPFFFPSISIF